MSSVYNRTTKDYRLSVNTPDFSVADWIINPDMSAVEGVNKKYHKVVGDNITEMTQAEKDSVDAVDEDARRSSIKSQAMEIIDAEPANHIMGMVLDKFAVVIKRELRNIKSNSPRTEKSMSELRQEVRDAIENGETI
jgi:hypothetical protein